MVMNIRTLKICVTSVFCATLSHAAAGSEGGRLVRPVARRLSQLEVTDALKVSDENAKSIGSMENSSDSAQSANGSPKKPVVQEDAVAVHRPFYKSRAVIDFGALLQRGDVKDSDQKSSDGEGLLSTKLPSESQMILGALIVASSSNHDNAQSKSRRSPRRMHPSTPIKSGSPVGEAYTEMFPLARNLTPEDWDEMRRKHSSSSNTIKSTSKKSKKSKIRRSKDV